MGALKTVAVLIAAATIAAVESRRPARADDGTTGFGLFVGSAHALPASGVADAATIDALNACDLSCAFTPAAG